MLRPLNEWDEAYIFEIDLMQETSELEKKKTEGLTRDKIAQEVCAFANASGGFIVFGMNDQKEGGGLDQGVEGLSGRTPIKAWIEQMIPTLLEPPVTSCQARFIPTAQHQVERGVLVLYVPDSDLRPHWVRGGAEEAYLRVGEHSGRMARRTFIDILNRRVSSVCEIVSLGPITVEKGADSQLITFNPVVKLVSGPFCKDWLVELIIPSSAGHFAMTNSVGVATQNAYPLGQCGLSLTAYQPLYPNRPTEVARPGINLRLKTSVTAEDRLKVHLFPESGAQVSEEFPLQALVNRG